MGSSTKSWETEMVRWPAGVVRVSATVLSRPVTAESTGTRTWTKSIGCDGVRVIAGTGVPGLAVIVI